MKRNGFTLIELLATIVVIAVVSLITVPVVVSVIEKSRKASFIRSAENIKKISKKYYVDNSLEYQDIDSIYFDCNNSECISNSSNIKKKNLGATGSMGDGYVKIYDKGEIEFLLTNGKYCAEKNPNKEEVKIYNGNCEGIIIDNEKIRINSIKTTSTTNTIKVFGDVITGKSGVSKYEFYIDNKLDATVKTNDTNYTHTFEKVSGKNHKIRVKVYNGTYGSENFDESIGMDEKEIDASLLDFGTITIAPSSTEWKTSKIYTISGATTGTTLQYKIVSGTTVKQDWTNYSSAITVNWVSTTKTPTYIYARLTDGVNTSDETTYTETKIDTTAPTLTLGTSTTTTKSIVVPITVNKDDESGIKSTKCAYGTTSSLGTYGTISGNSCVIDNVKSGTTYYYKVLTTNNAGLETSVVGNSTSKDFAKITITPSSTAWKTSKTYTISSATTGATLQYKIVSGTTVKQDWANYSSVITVNWASTTKTPTYIYARLTDGVNTSDETTYTETKIDTSTPSAPTIIKGVYADWTVIDDLTKWHNKVVYFPQTGKSGEAIVSGAVDNESGIARYEISSDNKTWYDLSKYNAVGVYSTTTSTTRYYRAVNNAGLASTSVSVNIKIDTTNPIVSYSLAGGTYNENKTVRVTVNDTNFKSMSVYVFKNKALVYTNKIASKSIDNTTKNTFDVLLDEDGDWTIYTKATDAASNEIVQEPINGNKFYYQTYVINSSYKTGDPIHIAGYDWHVIWDDGTKVALLMDGGQYYNTTCDRYGNCTSNYETQIMGGNAAWSGSKVEEYLNKTFLDELIKNGLDENRLYSTKICSAYWEKLSGSIMSLEGSEMAGYLYEELNRTYIATDQYGNKSVQKVGTCTGNFVSNKVRLLSYVEAMNLGDGKDSVPGNPYIMDRHGEDDWLFTNAYTYKEGTSGQYGFAATLKYEEVLGFRWNLVPCKGGGCYEQIGPVTEPSSPDRPIRPVIVLYK